MIEMSPTVIKRFVAALMSAPIKQCLKQCLRQSVICFDSFGISSSLADHNSPLLSLLNEK